MRRIKLGTLALLLLVGTVPAFGVAGQTIPRRRPVERSNIVESVVLVYGGVECETAPVPGADEGDLEAPVLDTCTSGWTGSGTIIDPSGLILTNEHVVFNDDGTPAWAVVAVTEVEDELPNLAFFAIPGMWDADLDLAVLLPVFTLDGDPIEEGEIELAPLPFPEEAGAVEIDDEVQLLGYPGLDEEETIDIAEAQVLDALPDDANPDVGDVGWLDVGEFPGPGISGGAMVDGSGVLVGVPTGGRGGADGGQSEELVRPLAEALPILFARAIEAGQIDPPAEEGKTPTAAADEPGIPRREPRARQPEQPAADTAIVTGTLVSADTGEPIAAGFFLVLQPDVTLEEFGDSEFDAELIFAGAESDGSGEFVVDPPVVRGQEYGIVAFADGFEAIAGEGIVLAAEDDPATVDLGLIELATLQ